MTNSNIHLHRFTKKQRDKLSNYWLGRPKPWLRGKPLSLEHKKKISLGQKNKKGKKTGNKRERREYHREYHNKHKLKRSFYYKEIRKSIIKYYGNKCACCGETEPLFLNIDHVNNDGAKHRKQYGSTYGVYLWIRRNNYPNNFQILCWNCNQAKGLCGICPHKKVVSA